MSTTFQPAELKFTRYAADSLSSIAAILGPSACGIYVLEFENGERYVGQRVNTSRRFYSHHRNTRHHAAWSDIAWVSFAPCDREHLDAAERFMIDKLKSEGRTLRNRVFNLGFSGPSGLEFAVSEETQQHWVNGIYSVDEESIREASKRSSGREPKLFRSGAGREAWPYVPENETLTVANAICCDLIEALLLLPDPVLLEGKYWSLSDYPATVGGRYATLNVGQMEALYFSRNAPITLTESSGSSQELPSARINLAPGTVDRGKGSCVPRAVTKELDAIPHVIESVEYPLTPVDLLVVPVGLVGEVFKIGHVAAGFRRLALDLMRKNQVGMYRRWHSPELARRAYASLEKGT